MPNDWQEELDRNYAWFLGQLSKLLALNQGRYALIYRQALVGVFDRPGDAEREAEARFAGQPYSIQAYRGAGGGHGLFLACPPLKGG